MCQSRMGSAVHHSPRARLEFRELPPLLPRARASISLPDGLLCRFPNHWELAALGTQSSYLLCVRGLLRLSLWVPQSND